MTIRHATMALAVSAAALPAFAEAEPETDLTEETNTPIVAQQLVAEQAMRSSSVTGVAVPLTLLSIGTIVAAPVSP